MKERLLEMLTEWLKCTDSPHTWIVLAEALESPSVGEKHLAKELRDKYCSIQEELSHPIQGSELIQPVYSVGIYAMCYTHQYVISVLTTTPTYYLNAY